MLRKFIAVILVLALCLTVAACAAPDTAQQPGTSSAQGAPSQSVPAGTALSVNGRTLSEDFIDQSVEAMAYYYDYTGVIPYDEFLADDAQVAEARSDALDAYTEQLALIAKAEAMGMLPVSDEEREQFRAESQQELETMRTSLEEYVAIYAAGVPDADVSTMAEDVFNYQLASAGFTEDNYVEGMCLAREASVAYGFLTQDITATDDDYKAYFDSQYAAQKADFESSPALLSSYYDAGTLLYYPEGSRFVKHILVKVPDEAALNAQSRYSTDPEGALALIADDLAALQPTIDEIMAKIEAGEDFDALIAQYGEDGGMTVEPGLSTGYFMYPGITTYYQEFTDAGMALEKVGDVSEPAATVYGYHIIKYASDPQPVTVDDMSYDMKNDALKAKKDAYITGNIDAWVAEATVERY